MCQPITTRAVPLPAEANQPKFPFITMKIGESFSVPLEQASSARVLAAKFKRRHTRQQWDYATRKEWDCLRVWRTR